MVRFRYFQHYCRHLNCNREKLRAVSQLTQLQRLSQEEFFPIQEHKTPNPKIASSTKIHVP